MDNKPKPDDRTDNVERIQFNIDNTIMNYRKTEDAIKITEDEKQRRELEEKNKRRDQALKGMRKEIRQEATDRENNYK
ncbi:MAG: small acid-soluble spore protein Tlp [Tissierellia bacterium]|jgi:small acid-soluble spore protein (thioredoxin-like protein)|nr:small acid-soluble spore protein Tlp [Tissierellia bacterium]MDD4439245.1 small acid-soluble spore protein Tlp [Tissierellia bacterium]HCS11771.1 small acid-soluble spore protein Tlp [Clostridiales bacterium]